MASSKARPAPLKGTSVAVIGSLRFSVVTVPGNVGSGAYATSIVGKSGVLAAEVNTPIDIATSIVDCAVTFVAPCDGGASTAGTCASTPNPVPTQVATQVSARDRPLPPTTKPIAILDTGVDPAAPQLAGRVLAGVDVTAAGPGNSDLNGHGTQVAAAAAGSPSGVSPTSPILPVKIYDATSQTSPESVVRGIAAAVSGGAGVINISSPLSLEAAPASPTSSLWSIAVKAAFQAGVITVVSAGDNGNTTRLIPAVLPRTLTVASADGIGVRNVTSNYGPWIDLTAPGANLVLPAPPSVCASGYANASGTSFSAAAVSGAVAMVAATRPKLGTVRLYDLFRGPGETDTGAKDFDLQTGFGQLNVAGAIGAAIPSNDPREINDDVWWLTARPTSFPTYLRKTTRTVTRGVLSPGKDPQDAFRVYLGRDDVLTAKATTKVSGGLMQIGIWNRDTGPFDIGADQTKPALLRSNSGLSSDAIAAYRATRAGSYYIAVLTPDPANSTDSTINQDIAPPRMSYSLSMVKRCTVRRTVRLRLSRLRRKGAGGIVSVTVYVDGAKRRVRGGSQLKRPFTLTNLRNGRRRITYKAKTSKGLFKRASTIVRARCKVKAA